MKMLLWTLSWLRRANTYSSIITIHLCILISFVLCLDLQGLSYMFSSNSSFTHPFIGFLSFPHPFFCSLSPSVLSDPPVPSMLYLLPLLFFPATAESGDVLLHHRALLKWATDRTFSSLYHHNNEWKVWYYQARDTGTYPRDFEFVVGSSRSCLCHTFVVLF